MGIRPNPVNFFSRGINMMKIAVCLLVIAMVLQSEGGPLNREEGKIGGGQAPEDGCIKKDQIDVVWVQETKKRCRFIWIANENGEREWVEDPNSCQEYVVSVAKNITQITDETVMVTKTVWVQEAENVVVPKDITQTVKEVRQITVCE